MAPAADVAAVPYTTNNRTNIAANLDTSHYRTATQIQLLNKKSVFPVNTDCINPCPFKDN
jgi:hypothetical protein